MMWNMLTHPQTTGGHHDVEHVNTSTNWRSS